jgi:hypothetical protein
MTILRELVRQNFSEHFLLEPVSWRHRYLPAKWLNRSSTSTTCRWPSRR